MTACTGCARGCQRNYPFRRCIHDMDEAIFTCPSFGLIQFESCPARDICKSECPGYRGSAQSKEDMK